MTLHHKTSSEQSPADHLIVVKVGDFIFREGDLGTEMYIVHEGKVEILQEGSDGETRLAVLEKGDFFGEMSLVEDLPRSASARVLADGRLVVVNGARFNQILRTTPEIAVRIIRKLSRRLRDTDRRLRESLGGEPAAPQAVAPGPSPASEPADTVVEYLSHAGSGKVFPLPVGRTATIGRKDPVTEILPDVDLTGLDTERSSSRQHAKIVGREGRLFVVEDIGTVNGTYVNDLRLQQGVPVEIRSGDRLRFGLVELSLTSES